MTNAENAIANLKNMKYLCETDNHGRGYGIFHVNEGDKAWIDEAIKALEREEAVLKALKEVKAEIEAMYGVTDTCDGSLRIDKYEALESIECKIKEIKNEDTSVHNP